MFYFKKNKEGPNIDMELEHSTLDVHMTSDSNTASSECHKCKKPLSKGQQCGVVSIGGKMVVEHERCPE